MHKPFLLPPQPMQIDNRIYYPVGQGWHGRSYVLGVAQNRRKKGFFTRLIKYKGRWFVYICNPLIGM